MSSYRAHLLGDNRSKTIIKDARNKELVNIGKQVLVGSSWIKEEEVSVAGSVLEMLIGIVGGFTGLDAPLDIRDLSGDFVNWEWSWGHALGTGIDAISIAPVAGMIKVADKIKPLVKAADKADLYADGFSTLNLKLVKALTMLLKLP